MTDSCNLLILHYKTIEKTIECIESALATTKDTRLCVIDNFSDDGSLEVLQDRYQQNYRIQFFPFKENHGYARANNLVMREIFEKGGKYAILTNNDIVFCQGSIARMIETLMLDNRTAIVAPKVMSTERKTMRTVMLTRDNKWQYFRHMTGRRQYRNSIEDCAFTIEVKQFSGCCFACNLDLLSSVGFMDDYTFLFFEELILATKLGKKGLKIRYEPRAEVIHYHGATTKSINTDIYAYMLDSEIYYLYRYLDVWKNILEIYIRTKRFVHKQKYKSEKLYSQETEILKKLIEGKYEKFEG